MAGWTREDGGTEMFSESRRDAPKRKPPAPPRPPVTWRFTDWAMI